jgi:tRNA (mo5U34)-methyltransferase
MRSTEPCNQESGMSDISARVASVPFWRHQIHFPEGVVSPGSQHTLAQLPTIGLPEDLRGWTVLDIGCSDGFYSFECERRGAERVVAVDNFSSVYIDRPNGFHVAHEILNSRVEFIQADLFSLDPAAIGRFDLVLFLGVLYHLRHPLLGLERVASLTKKQAIVETFITVNGGGRAKRVLGSFVDLEQPRHSMTFFPSDEPLPAGIEFNHDPTTFWAPSSPCAEAMLRLCGFCGTHTFSEVGGRGVFHGFAPAYGHDVERALTTYGRQYLATAASEILGCPVDEDDAPLILTLKDATISQFGEIKQLAAETRAREWQHGDRWRARVN